MTTDGLYRVSTDYLCAGFVVENGRVTHYAPILWPKRHAPARRLRNWNYYRSIAERVTP